MTNAPAGPPNPADLETDPRFPSGRWRGYYQQPGTPGDMELDLTFAGGLIEGTGRDPIGPFHFHGSYDASTGHCVMVKSYSTHLVDYRGYNEGQGIFGQWKLAGLVRNLHGGFRLWPVSADGHGKEAHAEADQPVDAEVATPAGAT